MDVMPPQPCAGSHGQARPAQPMDGSSDAAAFRSGEHGSWERDELESAYHDDPNVMELCGHNGMSKQQFLDDSHSTEHLDMFMSGCTSMSGVQYFPGLRSLCGLSARRR